MEGTLLKLKINVTVKQHISFAFKICSIFDRFRTHVQDLKYQK